MLGGLLNRICNLLWTKLSISHITLNLPDIQTCLIYKSVHSSEISTFVSMAPTTSPKVVVAIILCAGLSISCLYSIIRIELLVEEIKSQVVQENLFNVQPVTVDVTHYPSENTEALPQDFRAIIEGLEFDINRLDIYLKIFNLFHCT